MSEPNSLKNSKPEEILEKADVKKIADLSPNILFVIDLRELRIIYINQRVKELLGHDTDYIYKQGPEIFKTVIHPEDHEHRMKNLEKCKFLSDSEETVVEVRLRVVSEEWQWFRITDKIFKREEDGTVSKAIGTAQNIHESKIYKEKLKEEHRKYKNAQAIGHIGSFERKLPGNLVTYSDEFYRILGLEPKKEEIDLQEFMSHVHPDDRESYQAAINNTHATGEPLDMVTRVVRADGSIRYVHRRAAILKDENENPIQVYGTVQDITERIVAEEEKKKINSLIRATETVAATGSYEVDLVIKKIYLSDGLYSLLDEEPGKIAPSQEWLDSRSHPEDAAKVQKILEIAAATKEPYRYTRRIYRKNGEMRILEAQGKVITDAEGNAIKLIGLVQDITERKTAEEELRRSEEQSRNLLNVLQNAPDAYLVLSLDLRIEMASDAYLKATLTERKEIIGKYLFDVFPETPEVKDASGMKNLQASFDRVLATKKPHRMVIQHYDVPRPDGGYEEKHWSSTNSPVINSAGEVEYFIHRVLDVTEVIKKQKALTGFTSKTEMLKSTVEEISLQAGQLKESRALLKSVFDASPNSIVLYETIYDKNGKVEDFEFKMVNPYTLNTTRRKSDIIGKRLSKEFPTAVTAGVLDKFRKTAETGEPADFEAWYEEEGLKKWFHFRTARLNDLIVVTSEDITERKRSEETLKQMLNGSISAITMLDSIRDENGKITDFVLKGGNKAAEYILGVSTEELVGKRMLELWPGVKNVFFNTYVKVVENGETYRTISHYKHENFDNWFDISATKNGDGFIMTYHDITEQKKVEQELLQLKEELAQKATDKYSKIINAMDEGFCLLEIIRDKTGRCVDYRYLETNPVFEAQTGLKNVHGKTINEIVPNIENFWKEIYSNVASTGESIRFEDYAEGLNRWFDVNAFRIDAPNEQHVAVMLKDITERKEAEERQTFLLKLTDCLGPLVDPQEIKAEAMRLVGKHFNADRAYYYEIDENGWATISKGFTADGNSVPQRFPVSNFGELWLQAFQNDISLAVGNIGEDDRFSEVEKKAWRENGLSGGVGIPLVKEGRLIAVLGLNNKKPRSWPEEEIKLLQEVAERTWATVERAKIEKELKENEERLLLSMEAGNQFGWEVDLETGIVNYSGDQEAVLGFKLPASLRERLSLIHPHDLENFIKEYRQSLKDQTPLSVVQRLYVPNSQGKTLWTRMEGKFFGDPSKFIGTTRNINDEKKAEERQVFLLNLSDGLRTVDDPEEILFKAASILGEHLGAARVGYAEDMGDGENVAVINNYTNGVSGIEGIYSYKDYGEDLLKELMAGNLVIQSNILGNPELSKAEKNAHALLDLAALVNVPLIKKEKLFAILFIHFNRAHHFSDQEIALIEETADRTWAAVERARAEKALRETQESLSIALEAAQMGTWILDLTNSSSKRNFRHDQIFGYKTPQPNWNIEIAKKHVLREDHSIFDTAFTTALKTGKLQFEVRVRWEDGSIHWMEVNGHFYFDENGTPFRGAGVNFEVTDRRLAEEALRESEQRFRNLVEASALTVWETDPDGLVVMDSPSWRNFTGQTFEEIKGNRWKNAVHPEDREAAIENWEKAVISGKNFDYEFRLRSKEGAYRWTNIKAIPILDLEGNVTKWSGMNLDIHDRKEAEEDLRKAKEEAEAASRAKEDFLSTMSHEIRTPLNAIIGLTNLLMEQKPRNDQKENLSSLSFSAKNLLDLINDILDFSKLEAGKMETSENQFNLPDLLLNLQKAHQPQARSNGTKIILNLEEKIPQIIATDQVKLSQVLHNLVSNAVKFTKKGQVEISVELESRDEDLLWLKFAVKDTGIGIAADKADHIFDKFTQAESSTVRNYGGTGLGLSITKLLLHLLGSEIKVESKLGEGSRFYFTLPVKIGIKEFAPVDLAEISEEKRNLSHLRLLLVEDVGINRKIIMQFLQNWWQLKPDEATNGKEAVEKAKNLQYDIILMDIRMPEMDGFEATSLIRKYSGYEKTPILALTADKNQEIQQALNATQFTDMLTKPFDPADLKQSILKHLFLLNKDLPVSKEPDEEDTAGEKRQEKVSSENNVNERSPKDLQSSKELEDKTVEQAFEISRYKTLSAGNNKVFEKLIRNALKGFEIYKEEFITAANDEDLKNLSDLVHKNTTSIHYVQANRLARKIEEFRGILKTPEFNKGRLKELKVNILLEFDKIIEGLKSYGNF